MKQVIIMTFTTMVKEEIAKQDIDQVTAIALLSSFIRFDSKIKNKEITITMENASVARFIYKILKNIFQVTPNIIVRIQRRFRVKQIYILSINENTSDLLEKLNIMNEAKIILPESYFLSEDNDKVAYLKGLFLAVGSISNPKTSGYHFEYVVSTKKEADYINKLLKHFSMDSKVLKRNNKYMIYIKQAEMISDLLKMFGATNSMFNFEDIRIYRDHKNMVNRLNNCEIANQEKTIETGLKQLDDIKYLEDNDLISLLDDRIQEVINYRKKYPETSFKELADIVSVESGKAITKSGINHYFRKIKDLVNKHQKRSV
jgi:cell division protein WhiA